MVCTRQFCSYRDRGGDFAALNATVLHDHLLGLDYQSVDDLKAVLDTLPSASAA